MKSIRFIILLLVLLLNSAAGRGQALIPPSEEPDRWQLAFIDVETTGLIPGYHEMIDIGVVLAELDGREIARTHIRILPEHPERTSPGAVAVNGFNYSKWRRFGALSMTITVDSLFDFYERYTAGREVLMVAFNCAFDAAFLDHLFRSADRSWRELHHYFILDLPSMAWALGLRQLTGAGLSTALGIPDEPHDPDQHTGITGADLNIRIYRELLKLSSSH